MTFKVFYNIQWSYQDLTQDIKMGSTLVSITATSRHRRDMTLDVGL